MMEMLHILLLKRFFIDNYKSQDRPNYKLHPLSLVKVQFSPLNFDRFNLVL
jgi:hypothetical protein